MSQIQAAFESLLAESTLHEGRVSHQLLAGQIGRVALNQPAGQVSAVQARAWGEIRPGQACLVCQDSAGDWHVLPTDEAQLVRRRVVNYKHALPSGKPRPVYPFKILFTKVNTQGETEFYLGGDRSPQLLKALPQAATITGAYVANLGPNLDDWCVFIRYFQDLTPGDRFSRVFSLEFYNNEGHSRLDLPAVEDLLYLGSGFWSSVARASYGEEEHDYSGIASLPETCTTTGSPVPETSVDEQIITTIVRSYFILIGFNPDALAPPENSRIYQDLFTSSQGRKVITTEALNYTRQCVSEVLGLFIDSSATMDVSHGSAMNSAERSSYRRTCGTFGIEGSDQVTYDSGYYSGPPTANYVEVDNPLECLPEDSVPRTFSNLEGGSLQIDVQVSPEIKVHQFSQQQASISSNSGVSSSLRFKSVEPFLSGRQSCIYSTQEFDSSIDSATRKAVYFNDGMEEYFLAEGDMNPYQPRYSNLIGASLYLASREDFYNQNAVNRDFQATVMVKGLPDEVDTVETGLVFALGDPSEVEIMSMVYWPPDLSL